MVLTVWRAGDGADSLKDWDGSGRLEVRDEAGSFEGRYRADSLEGWDGAGSLEVQGWS